MNELFTVFDEHPAEAAAATVTVCVSAIVVLVLAVLVGRRALRALAARRCGDDVVTEDSAGAPTWTILTAAVATVVSADGMWQTFGGLGMPLVLRVATFAFLELLVLQSAIRARQAMRKDMSPGIDGVAMWGWTLVSALLSASHEAAGEHPQFVIVAVRFIAPLAAAWGWERSMSLERKFRTGRTVRRINWTLTPEKVLVRLGLADPTDRTVSEIAAQRHLRNLALAAKRARDTEGTDKAVKARRKLNTAMERAVEHGGLGTDPAAADILMSQINVLYTTADLLTVKVSSPWLIEAAPAPVTATAERVEPRADRRALAPAPELPEVDRDQVVADLAARIRDAAKDGEKYRVDYVALMADTGRQRRWCEAVWAEARSLSVYPGQDENEQAEQENAPQDSDATQDEDERGAA